MCISTSVKYSSSWHWSFDEFEKKTDMFFILEENVYFIARAALEDRANHTVTAK